jgi:hypothetical protein
MDITQETVSEWLDASIPRRDRDWLAAQCGVGVRAVGNWLNQKGTARPIPAEHQITIRRLMEEDAAKVQATPLQNLVLEFTFEEYQRIEQAALAAPESVREWSIRTLNESAALDAAAFVAALARSNVKTNAKTA